MRSQRKKIKPGIYVTIFVGICLLLIVISVFAGGILSPVKNLATNVLSPMQKGINSFGNTIFSLDEENQSLEELKAENKKLSEQVYALQLENKQLQQDGVQLERLQDLLKLKDRYKKYHTQGASIVSKGTSNWFDVFVIDKGSKDGMKVNMNVIADGGLVGIIYEVDSHYSKVRTIINDNSMVSAMFLKTNDTCIVNGNLETMDKGYLDVVYIDNDAKVKNGYELVTSSVSSKFLEGITIGTVSNIKEDSTKLTKTARVTPVVDFKHLKEVLVITDLKKTTTIEGETTD